MGHGVKHVVHAKFVSLCGHCDRIVGVVGMFPGVAHIHIEIDGDHQMSLIIVNPAPVLRAFHLGNDLRLRNLSAGAGRQEPECLDPDRKSYA